MKFNKKDLALSIEQSSYLQGSFQLRSGKISDFYFDKYQFESNPKLLHAIADHFVSLIPKETELLAGLELGGIPIATALSLKTGLPVVFVRKKPKEYGTKKQAEGVSVKEKKVLIVEDVITTGGAVLSSVEHLRQKRAMVQNVICVIYRNPDHKAPESFIKNHLQLNSLFCLSDFTSKKF